VAGEHTAEWTEPICLLKRFFNQKSGLFRGLAMNEKGLARQQGGEFIIIAGSQETDGLASEILPGEFVAFSIGARRRFVCAGPLIVSARPFLVGNRDLFASLLFAGYGFLLVFIRKIERDARFLLCLNSAHAFMIEAYSEPCCSGCARYRHHKHRDKAGD
jgi:hypothetical protein